MISVSLVPYVSNHDLNNVSVDGLAYRDFCLQFKSGHDWATKKAAMMVGDGLKRNNMKTSCSSVSLPLRERRLHAGTSGSHRWYAASAVQRTVFRISGETAITRQSTFQEAITILRLTPPGFSWMRTRSQERRSSCLTMFAGQATPCKLP